MRTLLALLLTTTTALADMGLPPQKYDIGGQTTTEVIERMHAVFAEDAPELIPLPEREVLAKCDRIQLDRYGVHYPAAETAGGRTLVGCLIRDFDFGNPVIVFTSDPNNPFTAVRLLRHEIGHQLGWGPDHPR